MNNFNPELYTISIRLELIDGDSLYVARISELPDVIEYSDSFEHARELALDTILTSKEIFDDMGLDFPNPQSFNEDINASGRLTVRLPKAVHKDVILLSNYEETSVNSLILSMISECIGNKKNKLSTMIDKLGVMQKEMNEPCINVELKGEAMINTVIQMAGAIGNPNNTTDVKVKFVG